MINVLYLTISLLALANLGRIGYWRPFPLFYIKLALATLVYANFNPNSLNWWDWRDLFIPTLNWLVLGASFEAWIRLGERLKWRDFFHISMIAGATGCLTSMAFPADYSTRIELFTVGAMAVIACYRYLASFGERVAWDHFVLVGCLNGMCAICGVSYIWIKDGIGWEILNSAFTTGYLGLVLLWGLGMPWIIREDARSCAVS